MRIGAALADNRVLRSVRIGLAAIIVLALMVAFSTACGNDEEEQDGAVTPGVQTKAPAATSAPKLSGSIVGDGSSTVFPITEAVAEEFIKVHPDVKVQAGISGTGGGFKKFCNGEIDFNDASRAIKDEEKQACADKGIDWVEFQVGFDGLSVVVNESNDFVRCMTVDELKRIWEPASTINNWKEIRSDFPDLKLSLYGPDTDSGTFEYFTEKIVGEAKKSRADYSASADDNVLVQGVAGEEGAMGYFGMAYYEENQDKLNIVPIDDGKGGGCVGPTLQTVVSGDYRPLSRPLFIYVKKDLLSRPEVVEFVRFYLTEGRPLVEEVGYVKAPDSVYEDGLRKLP